jgi:hypothetical protein
MAIDHMTSLSSIPDQHTWYTLAWQFRNAIEAIPQEQLFDSVFSHFPVGCCGDTSNLLASYLFEKTGVVAEYCSGLYGGKDKEIYSHAWLKVNGLIIDITADQFQDMGYPLQAVYVGPPTSWYQSFQITVQEDARHTSIQSVNWLDIAWQRIMQQLNSV